MGRKKKTINTTEQKVLQFIRETEPLDFKENVKGMLVLAAPIVLVIVLVSTCGIGMIDDNWITAIIWGVVILVIGSLMSIISFYLLCRIDNKNLESSIVNGRYTYSFETCIRCSQSEDGNYQITTDNEKIYITENNIPPGEKIFTYKIDQRERVIHSISDVNDDIKKIMKKIKTT